MQSDPNNSTDSVNTEGPGGPMPPDIESLSEADMEALTRPETSPVAPPHLEQAASTVTVDQVINAAMDRNEGPAPPDPQDTSIASLEGRVLILEARIAALTADVAGRFHAIGEHFKSKF